MKYLYIWIISFTLISCDAGQIEEFSFKKTLEYKLVEKCGEEDKECINAVKSQLPTCLEEAKWREFLENKNSSEEEKRFIEAFYPCLVDTNGKPLFTTNL